MVAGVGGVLGLDDDIVGTTSSGWMDWNDRPQLPRHAERPHTCPGRCGQLGKTCKTIGNTELTV